MADFTINNQGSIVLLHPNTGAARTWVDEHVGKDSESFQPWYPTVVCEPRYVGNVLEGIEAEGLSFDGDAQDFVSCMVDDEDDNEDSSEYVPGDYD